MLIQKPHEFGLGRVNLRRSTAISTLLGAKRFSAPALRICAHAPIHRCSLASRWRCLPVLKATQIPHDMYVHTCWNTLVFHSSHCGVGTITVSLRSFSATGPSRRRPRAPRSPCGARAPRPPARRFHFLFSFFCYGALTPPAAP